jgi:Ser/Thr protein kinase RdoA (MazF antagonist)
VLSRRVQLGRLRRVALRALAEYPLDVAWVRFVSHGENTTFRVRATQSSPVGGAADFLLRVHRPHRHGRGVDPSRAVTSELEWLAAITRDSALQVPRPVRSRDGELITVVEADGVEGARVCSLLCWADGRCLERSARPTQLERLGAAMAQLHQQADAWTPPPGFTRPRWDAETFFGDGAAYGGMVYGDLTSGQVWDVLPPAVADRFRAVAERVVPLMARLDIQQGATGLVHADLHLGNVLFGRGGIHLIDFDDCGTGYRIYDLAVALWELRDRQDYPAYRDATLRGYGRHRSMPTDQLAMLDDFIAVREVAFGLWYAGTARLNPEYAHQLDHELTRCQRSIDTLLG